MSDQDRVAPVAVVGLGAVLPSGIGVEPAWQGLLGTDPCIERVPREIWDVDLYLDPTRRDKNRPYSGIGAFVRGFEFRGPEFGMPPVAAEHSDPIQKVALVAAREALAAIGIEGPTGGKNAAVILGNLQGGAQIRGRNWLKLTYPALAETLRKLPGMQRLEPEARHGILEELGAAWFDQSTDVTGETLPGLLGNIAASRIAHHFDLHGPAYVTDAACASSLAAVEVSMAGLREGRFDLAVTGGVDMMMDVSSYAGFCAMGALSPDGSFPFDSRANGFVMGEGGVVLVLERLADARREGHRVLAVIRGVGSSSDGRGRSLVAPNPDGQVRAMQRAWKDAGLEPATVGFIEAHGTSTPLGDPTELEAMRRVFGGAAPRRVPFGSVKGHLGHLKGAAGAAGLFRAVLALHHRTIPPQAGFRTPNPDCQLDSSCFYVPTQPEPFGSDGGPRRAAVNAFGFGGVDYHLVLEEADPAPPRRARRAPLELPLGLPVLALGGASRAEVLEAAKGLVRQLAEPGADLAAVARSLAAGPALSNRPVRAALVPRDLESARTRAAALVEALEKGSSAPRLESLGIAWREGEPCFGPDQVAFLFPGQGSQYVGMLDELRARYPVVAEVLAEADRIMGDLLEAPLTSYLYPPAGTQSGQAFRALMRTEVLQPAMLTCDEALRRLVLEIVEPRVVLGHSLGEYAACIAAGVLSFDDCLRIVAARGGAMEEVSVADPGLMLGVGAGEAEVQEALDGISGYVTIVNKNCPNQTILGGATEAVKAAGQKLKEKGLETMLLPVSHAFHSKIVAPASAPLRRALDKVTVRPPAVPILSNVTGEPYPDADTPETLAWIRATLARQVASPVEWIADVERAYAMGARVFIEVGPKRALAGFVGDILGDRPHRAVVLVHPKQGELEALGRAVAALVVDGVVPLGAARPSGAIARREPWVGEAEPSAATLAAAAVPTRMSEGAADLGVVTDPHFWQFLAHQGPELVRQLAASYRAARLLQAPASAPISVPVPMPVPVPAQVPTPNRPTPADLEAWVLGRVAELTGYAAGDLALDADLEGELGIDSIRQVEIVLALRDELGLGADEAFQLRDYPTLKQLIGYLRSRAEGGATPPAAEKPPDLTSWVTARVADATGYAPEELDLDADLETELGIDSIRQIEIMLAVRDQLGIAADDGFRPSEHSTLRKLIAWLEPRLGSERPF
jgi:acyl transferase domain-containing protein/acyl carrier protein